MESIQTKYDPRGISLLMFNYITCSKLKKKKKDLNYDYIMKMSRNFWIIQKYF